jgi:pentapeptide MXKDX repeat protein
MNASISWLPLKQITKKQFGKERVLKFILAHTTALKMKEIKTMKKLMAICFALAILTWGIASAQDTMKNDTMKADSSKKAAKVTGKISEDGKSFVSDSDSKTWTIANPDAVKGHEGHHVTLTAHVNSDKGEVHVVSLKMAKADKMDKMAK